MKLSSNRYKHSLRAMGWHLLGSSVVAAIVAAVVFGVWFSNPYHQLAGGTNLFFLIMGVDLICGPLLTFVLFNPTKSRRELVVDLSLVVLLQLVALAYGTWTVYQARPLYLVHEVDRFKVIALPDIDARELQKLPESLLPRFLKGPETVGLREGSNEEREKVMFESIKGGRDFGERPSFYAPYDAEKAVNAYNRAKPVANFLKKYPNKQDEIVKIQTAMEQQWGKQIQELRYLPIIARQDWIAVLNPKGEIVGYIKGDGF
jgi:hypothetical protein